MRAASRRSCSLKHGPEARGPSTPIVTLRSRVAKYKVCALPPQCTFNCGVLVPSYTFFAGRWEGRWGAGRVSTSAILAMGLGSYLLFPYALRRLGLLVPETTS